MIDGKAVAQGVRERVRDEVAELAGELGRPPGLATVLVGDDPGSAIYVRRKHEASDEVGIRSFDHQPDASISQEDLLELVAELNENAEVDGILVQLPLPEHLDAAPVIAELDPGKDVDGLTPTSAGLLARGEPGLVPATPQGVMELIKSAGVDPEGKEAVIVGPVEPRRPATVLAAARRRRHRHRLPQPHRRTSARSAGAPRSWSPPPVGRG